QTARILTGEQPVAGVAVPQLWPRLRRLLIGRGRGDQPNDMFYVPSVLAKLDRQPVQHFRVAWRLALQSKVIDRIGEAGAEELLPKAVYDRAGGEGILRGNDPLREVEPGLAVGAFA